MPTSTSRPNTALVAIVLASGRCPGASNGRGSFVAADLTAASKTAKATGQLRPANLPAGLI
jgi:hypothetical protein